MISNEAVPYVCYVCTKGLYCLQTYDQSMKGININFDYFSVISMSLWTGILWWNIYLYTRQFKMIKKQKVGVTYKISTLLSNAVDTWCCHIPLHTPSNVVSCYITSLLKWIQLCCS